MHYENVLSLLLEYKLINYILQTLYKGVTYTVRLAIILLSFLPLFLTFY